MGCQGLFWGTRDGFHRLSSEEVGGVVEDCLGVLGRYQGLFGDAHNPWLGAKRPQVQGRGDNLGVP